MYEKQDIHKNSKFVLRPYMIRALIVGFFKLGITNPDRKYFWKLLFWSIKNKPDMWSYSIQAFARAGHFRDVYKNNTYKADNLLKEMKLREDRSKLISDNEIHQILEEVS